MYMQVINRKLGNPRECAKGCIVQNAREIRGRGGGIMKKKIHKNAQGTHVITYIEGK